MDNDFMSELEGMMDEMKFREVIEKITELEEEEKNEELMMMLAHCYSQCGEYRNALRTLRVIENDVEEDDMAYHLELAGANFGLHKYQTAISEAKRALEIDVDCIEAWLLLCLVYQEKNDDEKFEKVSEKAREIDEQAWLDIFGDKSDRLAVYTEEEKAVVCEFITDNFCDSNVKILSSYLDSSQPIELIVLSPNKFSPYYTTITIGLGAYSGIEIREDQTKHIHRTEIIAQIPDSLDINVLDETNEWLNRIIRQFSEMVQIDSTWLGVGHTISYGNTLDDSVEYDGVIFDTVVTNGNKCILPCGEEVEFLQLIPLYEEEMLFKIENGSEKLFERLQNTFGESFDKVVPVRENVCRELKRKRWGIYRSSMEDILDWDGPDGCYATDRITVDNQKVGIMYREPPEDKRDSGWRFLAGDEDEKYMNDINNMDIFRLNTICNYDPDIIEYLENPVGSAFYRDENGNFRPMDFHSKR